jgi:hypothetical protein
MSEYNELKSERRVRRTLSANCSGRIGKGKGVSFNHQPPDTIFLSVKAAKQLRSRLSPLSIQSVLNQHSTRQRRIGVNEVVAAIFAFNFETN